MLSENVKIYYDAKKNLTPLIRHRKQPAKNNSDKNYNEIKLPQKDIYDHVKAGGNVGMVVGYGYIVVDVDPRNGGGESYVKLCKDLFIKLIPTVVTPSGGTHYYLALPEKYIGQDFRKNHPDYPGIDFLKYKDMVVIPGSIAPISYAKTDPRYIKDVDGPLARYEWADIFTTGLEEPFAPVALLELFQNKGFDRREANLKRERAEKEQRKAEKSKVAVKKDRVEKSNKPEDDDWFIEDEFAPWSDERLMKTLYDITPNCGYDEWYKVGMALQASGRENWFDIWKEWSKTGDTYVEGVCEEISVSFKKGDGITLGTLDFLAYGSKQDRVDDNIEKVAQFILDIGEATESTIRGQICPEIRKSGLEAIDLAKIESCLQARLYELCGVKPSISVVRGMIKSFGSVVVGAGGLVEGFDGNLRPEWCNNYVYVQGHNCFINLSTLEEIRTEGFNLSNTKYVPVGNTGTKQSAMKYVSENGFVSEVSSMGYFPEVKELIVTWGGKKMINVFNHAGMPQPCAEYSTRGLACVEGVKRHIKAVFMGDVKNVCGLTDAEFFTCWLAHQVQHLGVKILWVPVIQSIEGVGKSFFRELLQLCLGVSNVGIVNPSQVVSQFNGWAARKLVNVLEELKIPGHNRLEAANALKPLITDNTIQINEKGVKPYTTNNTANYLCFTNFKDFLPISDSDRRWWITYSPFETKAEMGEYLGEDVDKYFINLFNELRACSGDVLKWLAEYPIPQSFLDTKNAPMTESKKLSISTEESNHFGLNEARELINEGGVYFVNGCVSSGDLYEKLEHLYIDFRPTNQEKNNILKKLGYSKLEKNIKIDGKMRMVWVKKNMDAEKVRELIGKKSDNIVKINRI